MARTPTTKTWQKLVALVRRRGAGDDAEDLVQEAYARMAGRASRDPVVNPEGFVLRAAHNLAVTAHRTRSRHERIHADEAVTALITPAAVPDEVIAARARLRVVEAAIAELPPRAREVFVMHRVDGMKYGEIAAALGISTSAVEKHMARALTRLACRVEEFGRGRDRQG